MRRFENFFNESDYLDSVEKLNDDSSMLNLAITYKEQDQHDKALSIINKYIEKNPSDIIGYKEKVTILFNKLNEVSHDEHEMFKVMKEMEYCDMKIAIMSC